MSKQNTGRKFFATAATAALVASAIVPVASAAEFTDAEKIASWATEAVEALAANEVISGNPDGSFNPTGTVTRAQAAKMFTVALGLDTKGTETFADVKDGQWFQEYVVAVVNAGIVNGMTATEFAPNRELTREQAAKMIVEAYGLEGAADLSTFADAKSVAGKWSEGYLATAVENGIIAGKGDKLAATDSISRQEFAVMLNRAITGADTTEADKAAAVKAVEEATAALEEATKALSTEVATDKIAEAKAAVAAAKEAATKLEEAVKAATELEAITEEQAKAATEATAKTAEAVKVTEAAIAKAEEAAKELVVESVKAINGSQLEVKFSKPVTKSTVITGTNTLSNVAISAVGSTTVTVGTLTAELSDDAKVLTITSTTAFDGKYSVEITEDVITNKENIKEKLAKSITTLDIKDTVAPALLTDVKYDYDAVTAKYDAVVKFSEPVSSVGTLTLGGVTLTAGTDYTVSGINEVTIKSLKAETSFDLVVVGAKDKANNFINPNPTTLKLTTPAKDTVKPTMTLSVTDATLTLKFSEKIDTTAGTVTIGSTTVAVSALTKDTTDKTETTYTYNAATLAPNNGFLNTTVKVTGVKDVAGNVAEDFSQAVTLVKDTTAAKFVSATSKGADILVKFDEAITTAATMDVTVKYTSPESVVIPTQTISVGSVEAGDIDGNGTVSNEEKLQHKLTVTTANLLSSGSLKEGTYEIELPANSVTDAAGNVNEKAISFKLVVDAASVDAEKTISYTATAGTPGEIKLAFANTNQDAKTTDVTNSALDYKNYKLAGEVIPADSVIYFENDKQNVVIELPASHVIATGDRVLEASNIVDGAGNTLVKDSAQTVSALLENIKPVATKVTLVDGQILEVTFSEAIGTLPTALSGLTVKVNGTTATLDATPVSVSTENNVLKVTAASNTAFKLTDEITVEFNNTNIIDVVGNTVTNITLKK